MQSFYIKIFLKIFPQNLEQKVLFKKMTNFDIFEAELFPILKVLLKGQNSQQLKGIKGLFWKLNCILEEFLPIVDFY